MSYCEIINNGSVICTLCPHNCKIAEGKTGICRVRKNVAGIIQPLTYGIISGYAVDPIEKKPLYHFYPGSRILSIGSYGCNLRCDFCQNYDISQQTFDDYPSDRISPEEIAEEALRIPGNLGIAFTYNEPVIWFEYMRDVAIKAHENNLKTVMVSNGFVNREPLTEIISFIDAFNIDLKAFNNTFYQKLTKSGIKPVKETLIQIAQAGRHLEIATLIIPGQNDSVKEMSEEAAWIAGETGKATPLHINRYFPRYRRNDASTPLDTLRKLAQTASQWLDNVHIGNV